MMLDDLASNLGLSFELFVLFITVTGSIILMAKDLRLGILLLFMLLGVEFLVLNSLNRIITYHIFALLIVFVLLVVVLLISHSRQTNYGMGGE